MPDIIIADPANDPKPIIDEDLCVECRAFGCTAKSHRCGGCATACWRKMLRDPLATCVCGRELVPGEGGVFVCVICSMDPADCRCFARTLWSPERRSQ